MMKKILWGGVMGFYIVLCSYTLFETSLGDQTCYEEGVTALPLENGNTGRGHQIDRETDQQQPGEAPRETPLLIGVP